MLEFPLDPFSSHCLLSILSEGEDVQDDIITLMALMNTDNLIHFRQLQKQEMYLNFRKKFFVPNSDHLTYLKLFYCYVGAENKKQFCKYYCLRQKSFNIAILIRDQLKQNFQRTRTKLGLCPKSEAVYSIKYRSLGELMKEIRVKEVFQKEKILGIMKRGYFNKVCMLGPDNQYQAGYGVKTKIHPESFLFSLKNKPKTVLYNQIIQTTNYYLSMVSEVN